MKNWPRQFSFWLVLCVGVALAAELAWLETQRRNGLPLTQRWQQQLRLYEELAKASPARTAQNEQAMADEVMRLAHDVAAARAKLFPRGDAEIAGRGSEERIDAYFGVADLVGRLRAAANAADVVVKPDEHFGFAAFAHEAPPAADLARVEEQCFVGEILLNCLFSCQPRELFAVKRELLGTKTAAADRQQPDYFQMERGLSLRGDDGLDAMAFRLEFSGETAVLRRFLQALARSTELLVVRSVEALPIDGNPQKRTSRKETDGGPIVRPALSRFVVTVEAIRPAKPSIARTP